MHGKARLVAEREGIAYEIGERGWQRVVNPKHLSQDPLRVAARRLGGQGLPGLTHIEVDPDLLSGRPANRGPAHSGSRGRGDPPTS